MIPNPFKVGQIVNGVYMTGTLFHGWISQVEARDFNTVMIVVTLDNPTNFATQPGFGDVRDKILMIIDLTLTKNGLYREGGCSNGTLTIEKTEVGK
jgi:hypothetical protein